MASIGHPNSWDQQQQKVRVEVVPGTLMIAMRRNGLVVWFSRVVVKRDKCRRPEVSGT